MRLVDAAKGLHAVAGVLSLARTQFMFTWASMQLEGIKKVFCVLTMYGNLFMTLRKRYECTGMYFGTLWLG
jgi:hypothetical protein